MSLVVTDANNNKQTIKTADEVVTALAALSTDAKLEAVRALLAAPLALPTGAATDAKLETLRALLAALPLPTGAATAARQDASLAASKATAITPSDTADLAAVPVALYVGTGGDLAIQGVSDTGPVVWKAVPAGSLLPMRVKRVYATGTTAANLLAVS